MQRPHPVTCWRVNLAFFFSAAVGKLRGSGLDCNFLGQLYLHNKGV